ncbi:uncharacterized protein LOC131682759 [Topomyia yanbarensis]|uniref:uncharacterized protein LOC131682759 n=1 Tax=Topomyia yanbarensis TaxID=2498891 RepID=UPI00273C80BC|nr:uncharacterized protein LOC131682759 [Topomyia yanbarensis]
MLWLVYTRLIFAIFGFGRVLADECGQRTALTRQLVHFGNQSRLGEWPWHAGLFHRMNRASPSYACGGTILSKNYVITAAHCTYPESRVRPLLASEILVRTGIANIQQLEHSLQQFSVAEIVRHDEYNTDTLDSDIALLKLAGELEFTDYVKRICYWQGGDGEELIIGKEGVIAGWGKDENEALPDMLQHAVMPIVSRKACRDSDPGHYTRFLYDRKTFCAGYRNGTSAGPGDSGGGLYIEIEGKWRLRGIVSNGKINPVTRSLDTKSYVVFTDVAYYMPWINQKVSLINGSDYESSTNQHFALCGKNKQTQFSRTGFKEERKWPWQGEVYKNGKPPTRLCEVAIISNLFVLSPAEVYSDNDVLNPSQLLIIFKVIRNFEGKAFHYMQVRKIIRHENFNRQARKNNIALLQLKDSLQFSELLRPICLWGSDPPGFEISKTSGYLGEFNDLIAPHDECVKIYKMPQSSLDEHSLCITISVYQFRTTLGDTLFLKFNDSWYLRGISFNMVKRDYVYYVLLLDVAYYKDWIERNSLTPSQNLLALSSCSNASPDQWLHNILNNYVLQCFAALISPTLLVTTASCVEGVSIEKLSVGISSKVSKVYQHPAFNKLELSNNIAIVKVEQPLENSPICLPRITNINSNLDLQHRHWQPVVEFNDIFSVNFTSSNVRSCAKRWQREGAKVDTSGGHICGQMLGFEKGPKYQCNTNLHGSPLVMESGSNVFLRGILDIGKGNHCELNDLPEVYIDVMFYSEWITEIEKANRMGSNPVPAAVNAEVKREEWRTGK